MERRMKSKQGFHTRSKSLPSEEPLESAMQRQLTYDDYQTRKMDGGGDQDVWMNSFSSWKMKRMKATSLERDRKAERDEVEQSHGKLKRKKSKTFREIVEEKQRREKMCETNSIDTDDGEITEILNDLPSTNLDSDNEQELQKSLPVFEQSAPPPHQNYREERDRRRNEMISRMPEPEVITVTESSRVYAAPPPTAARRDPSPPATLRLASVTLTKPQGSDSTDKPLTFWEKVLRAHASESESQVTHQQAKEAARKPYRAKGSNIFDKIKAFDSGEAFKKVVEDAVEANRKPQTRLDTEEADYEDIVIIMTQRARSHKGFGFTTSGGYDEKKPLVVSTVSPESVAGYSDLRVGDQILSINKESTRRFNQDDVHQCLSQSVLTGKLTCKVRRYPNGKMPENVLEPTFQKSHPFLQERKPSPAQTAPKRSPLVRDPPPPTTRAPATKPPSPSERTHPPVPVECIYPTPSVERVHSPPVTERLQTLTEVEPPEDADLDILRPERTKNALARARQMLDELEMEDESSSRSSEITDQSPVLSQQSINKAPFSQPINANGPPRSNDSSVADDESQSSDEGVGGFPEPALQPTAPSRGDIISFHTPSSSLDEGSMRSQDSFPRGFRSIAAPRPRGQSNPPNVNGTFQSIPGKQSTGPQSDVNKRRTEFFPNEDEYDRAMEPIVSPDSEHTSQLMPAPQPIKPSTAYRKPFNREEERRRLEKWNEEQERRRQEKYELEQQRLREEEERALSAAAEVDRKKREQEERELEARRLERQRQQEELQQVRQRQLEDEENRKKARLEKERQEREEADRKRQEEMQRQAAERKWKEEIERKEREKEAAERKKIEEQKRLQREREQREEAAREVIRREQEEYARVLQERERERQEQERIQLEKEEQKRLEEEEEAERLQVEKWRRESEEREKADKERERAQQEARRQFQEEERERIRAEEREKMRQEWEEERQRELEQLRLEKERLQREREELDSRQEEERQRLQAEKERIKKEKELEQDSPPVIEVPLSKMTNGYVMSAPKQSLSSESSPRSVGHSSGSVGQSPRSVSQSPKSVQSPRTVSPATQRTRENNQRNMMPERDRPPSHTIMSSYKDPSLPSNQHWLVEEANRRRLANQKGIERQPPPDVIAPPHNGVSQQHPHSRYPKGFDPQIPTRIPAQRRHPPQHSQEAPAKMTGVQRRMRGPEDEAARQRKMVNRRSLPDLSSGRENAVPSNIHTTAQQVMPQGSHRLQQSGTSYNADLPVLHQSRPSYYVARSGPKGYSKVPSGSAVFAVYSSVMAPKEQTYGSEPPNYTVRTATAMKQDSSSLRYNGHMRNSSLFPGLEPETDL